jgi:hypothetical protein
MSLMFFIFIEQNNKNTCLSIFFGDFKVFTEPFNNNEICLKCQLLQFGNGFLNFWVEKDSEAVSGIIRKNTVIN